MAEAPAVHLDPQERDGDVGEPPEQRVPQRRVAVHQRLGLVVVLGRPALHQVGREREGASGEPDQRPLAQFGHERPDRLGHVGHVARVQGAQPLQIPGRAHRSLDHRPDPGLDVHVDSDRAQRDHDVAEQDGRVHVVPAQRLQGDLGDQLGAGARVEHRDALPHPPVLGQRPARLPHEPDRRIGHWLSPAGQHEGGLRLGHGHVRDPSTSPHGSRRETRRPRSHESAREHATIGINPFNSRRPRDASHRGGRQDDAAEQARSEYALRRMQ